ncbi:hypothetical protein [Deminuibacter soli]|uniref:Copper-binding protein n=1 Tax=Deminuibacter soli TaxID=2291815 RepID=A0A3E1NQ87_9BACT|nr:hypothetical protein [Deminuibacter soli]RFM30092.1 hypothetical protein DXN05_03715 [Deminuibacter soli]
MKRFNKQVLAAAVIIMSTAVACSSSKQNNPASGDSTVAAKETKDSVATQVAPKDSVYTASGTITEIQRGKDGYVAVMKAANGTSFRAMMSFINLQKEFRSFQPGDKLQVSGDTLTVLGLLQVQVKKYTQQ